jgi:hypothetical protein
VERCLINLLVHVAIQARCSLNLSFSCDASGIYIPFFLLTAPSLKSLTEQVQLTELHKEKN